jgi:hypothetical protein
LLIPSPYHIINSTSLLRFTTNKTWRKRTIRRIVDPKGIRISPQMKADGQAAASATA